MNRNTQHVWLAVLPNYAQVQFNAIKIQNSDYFMEIKNLFKIYSKAYMGERRTRIDNIEGGGKRISRLPIIKTVWC